MNRKRIRIFAKCMLALMAWQVVFPLASHAVTGGPSQPEVQGFDPIGTSDMVDLFSGDFHYNIPLMDVGGYPINLGYNAGPSMDEEASWVGLGWNLNVGSINRNLRGLPDEFAGDPLKSTYYTRPNRTVSVGLGAMLELFGKKGGETTTTTFDSLVGTLNRRIGLVYNNYHGWGFDLGANVGLPTNKSGGILTGEVGLGFNTNGLEGTDVSANMSLASAYKNKEDQLRSLGNRGLSVGINSRAGLRYLCVNSGMPLKSPKPNTAISGIKWGTSTFGLGTFPIEFAHPTYQPAAEHPMSAFSIATTVQIGVEGAGPFAGMKLDASFEEQSVADIQITSGGYGYFNLDKAKGDEQAVLDFNREKNGQFSENTPHLGQTALTHDLFVVTGMGSFRARRGDAGIVSDPHRYTASHSLDVGVDIGGGNIVKSGFSFSDRARYTETGRLVDDIASDHRLSFQSTSPDVAYEPFYLQMEGEKKSVDGNFASKVQNGDLVYLPNTGEKFKVKPAEDHWRNHGLNVAIPTDVARAQRDPRNLQVSFLTGTEASAFGLQKKIKNYTLGGNGLEYVEEERVVADRRPAHHPSEYLILTPDGSRQVYGLPAYNLTQQDVSFALGTEDVEDAYPSYSCSNPLQPYYSADDQANNGKGMDQFYSKQETPAYAHSYLLTASLSADYEDVGQDGPTPDDLGSYVQFNYGKLPYDYGWRSPFIGVRHDRGLKSDPTDDRGSYIYGTKEVWYLKSIVTRDYIAVFDLEDRLDGHGSNGPGGGINGSAKLKQLASIELFALHEYEANPTTAVPLKTVHFEYTNELCPGVPNGTSGSGKLTLKKVWFTYRNSAKGQQNLYEFHYDNDNPYYNETLVDRWGVYSGAYTCTYSVDGVPLGNSRPTPSDWPYTVQNKAEADSKAAAWSLSQIDLPSGGTIHVEYESDDYGWVQDRPAMQMFQVTGVSTPDATSPVPGGLRLYDGPDNEPLTRIYFNLQHPVPDSYDAHQYLFINYFRDMKWLYFKFLVDMAKAGAAKKRFEHVPGYAEIENYGMVPASGGYYTQAWVEMKKVDIGDREKSGEMVHPVSKAAWQNARLYEPWVVYPGLDADGPLEAVAMTAVTLWDDLKTLFTSIHRVMRSKGHGREYLPEFSFIRLQNPSGTKFGGGHRVKRITLDDGWGDMRPGQSSFSYGQEYFYTVDRPTDYDHDGVVEVEQVSSGVAQWEPLVGGDENPFHLPVPYVKRNVLAMDEKFFLEEPLCESMFPGPSVGYGTVTVRNIRHENVTLHATGFVRNEFYTAKDFPTVVSNTPMDKDYRTTKILRILGFNIRSFLNAAEGFLVERNDMHGKPKAAWTYSEKPDEGAVPGGLGLKDQGLVSGVEYFYKETTTAYGRRVPSNTVDVVDASNQVTQAVIGESMDVYVDAVAEYEETCNPSVGFNLDGINATPPVIVPTVWPWVPQQKKKFQSVTTTKVIDRSGILDRVVAHDRQARIPTQNLLWDKMTGEVLLTQTWNEFHEPLFSLSMPSHWAYKGMGPAWQNQGLTLEGINFALRDAFELPVGFDVEKYFEPGDEVYRMGSDGVMFGPYWVNHLDPTLRRVYLIDETGYHDGRLGGPSNQTVKVIRSGHRNQHTAGIMTVSLKDNPVTGTSYPKQLDLVSADMRDEILGSGAVEYSDVWKMQCKKSAWRWVNETWEIPIGGTASDAEPCTSMLGAYEDFLNEMVAANYFDRGDAEGLFLTSGFPAYQSQIAPGVDYRDALSWPATSPYRHELNRDTDDPGLSWGWQGYINFEVLIDHPSDPDPAGPGEPDQTICNLRLWLANRYGTYPDILEFSDLTATGTSPTEYQVKVRYNMNGEEREHFVKLNHDCPCGVGTGGTMLINVSYVAETSEGVKGSCSTNEGEFANPWLNGLRGHYRGKSSYAFLEDRVRNLAGGTDLREGGKLEDYTPFWWYAGGHWTASGKTDQRWQTTGATQEFHPLGVEVQSVDALGNQSAALTGYNESLVTLVGQNAERRNLLFDGFEEYVLSPQGRCMPYHWKSNPLRAHLSEDAAHTGKYSLKSTGGKMVGVIVDGLELPSVEACTTTATAPSYIVSDCDCMETFTPQRDRKYYVVSAWVKESHTGPTPYQYTIANLTLGFLDGADAAVGSPIVLRPSGPVIEGWQRIEAEVELPATAHKLDIKFKSPGITAYLDDLKIAPYDAVTNSYVYDPVTRRLVAELDHNHYATFYEYDEEGGLIRMKKESERGVQTLTETRGNLGK